MSKALVKKHTGALTKYDPVKGVLSMHAAKEAEKRARRVKDLDALDEAIEAKLTHQSEFVDWWDTEAARRKQGDPGRETKHPLKHPKKEMFLVPEDFGFTVKMLSKWRTKLNSSPEKFRETLSEEREHARRRLWCDVSLAAVQHEERRRLARQEVEAQNRQKSLTAFIEEGASLAWLAQQQPCDLLLTDPPYSTDVADVAAFASEWLPLALGRVKPTGRAYVCIGAYPDELKAYLNAPSPFPLQQVLVWTYRNTLGPTPKDDYKLNWQAVLYFRGPDAPPLNSPEMNEQFSVQDINAPDGRIGDRYHAWQKPELLGERFVRHASKPGDRVLDPFAGTGTFLLAAAKLGRSAYGCDIDPDQVALAIERGCRRA